MRQISRRRFIGEMSCAAVGASSLFSSLLTLRLTAATVTPSSNYRALVCLFLYGGNDSFNMLVPRQSAAYNQYATTRDNVSLAQADLLPISSINQPFTEFGLHPSLTRLQSIYNSGNLAFLANVGTLIEPMTVAKYNNSPNLHPKGLFSHSDQQFHWQTVLPQYRGTPFGGWAGRVADAMQHLNTQRKIAMNVSLNGVNVLQTGNETLTYSVSSSGTPTIDAYQDQTERVAVDTILAQSYKNLYQQSLADKIKNSYDTTEVFDNAVSGVTLNTVFPSTDLASKLKMIARTIAARSALCMDNQIFFVGLGGWDHHTELLNNHNGLLTQVDGAVGAFWDAMVELGVQNDVTLFSASDFGRTLASNGQGTDHAWGSNQFVLGGSVNGGRIYGQYPELAIGSSLDVGRGRLVPTTSVDVYCAELASWFGVPAHDIATVLPNIGNFVNPVTTPRPLGLLT
ncbi:MAG: DUF1501 domain-containing protein [Pseudomonadota bacterium]